MKRILLLTNIFPSGENPAGGTFIKSRIRALRDLGVEVDAAGVGVRPRGANEFKARDFMDATVEASLVRRAALWKLGRSERLERLTVARLSSQVDLASYDGIMAHGMFALGSGRVAARLARTYDVPFTVHLHGSDVNHVMPRHPRADARILDRAAAAVFVSDALRRRAVELGYGDANAVVTGNGVDSKIFTASEKRSTVGGPLNVVFVGNLLPVKGADRLPDVMECIWRKRPEARLSVVGGGPLMDSIQERLHGRDASFLGRLEAARVAEVMREADVVILPSRSEGWPTVINESYAVGTPVVASDVGGVREALIDERWAVPLGDDFIDTFADRVLEAAEAPDPQALEARARQFSWGTIAAQELAALGGSR